MFFKKIGHDDGDTSTNASHAMNKDIGIFPSLLNEIEGGIEMLIEFIVFVILSWNVEVEVDVLFLVMKKATPSN